MAAFSSTCTRDHLPSEQSVPKRFCRGSVRISRSAVPRSPSLVGVFVGEETSNAVRHRENVYSLVGRIPSTRPRDKNGVLILGATLPAPRDRRDV